MLKFEDKARQNGFTWIIGIDEAGRGPLAGPVVAAAVSLKKFSFDSRINDSKKMTPKQREKAFYEIFDNAYVGVGIMSEAVIDEINILQATFCAMRNAVAQLTGKLPEAMHPDFSKDVCLLVDGNAFKSDLPYRYETIVNGDGLSLSIACASIVAKVTRDRILNTYDRIYPEYGFKQHKGYPTAEHRHAIQKFGPSIIQRKSFQFSFDND